MHREPVGVVLAGGRGRRLGGAGKALLDLCQRPMLHWSLTALCAELEHVVVAAKKDTALPLLPDGVELWSEPARPRHPLAGIAHALRRSGGRPVLVCAVDLPLVDAAAVRTLADADAAGAPAVVAEGGGHVQPLLGRYEPAALGALTAAPPDARVLEVVRGMGARTVALDAGVLLNVNTADDVAAARRILARRLSRM